MSSQGSVQYQAFTFMSDIMQTRSHIISLLDKGLVLDVVLDELDFTAYVALSEPDINRVAEIVPQERYEKHQNLHVAAVDTALDAQEQVRDIAFNMDQGDAAVFLCRDEAAYCATLQELGQHNVPTQAC